MHEYEVHIFEFLEKEKKVKNDEGTIEIGSIGTKNNNSITKKSINHKVLKMFLLGQRSHFVKNTRNLRILCQKAGKCQEL